jgi:hypothetical protein
MAYERTWQPAKFGPWTPASYQEETQKMLWLMSAFLMGKTGYGTPTAGSKWTCMGSSAGGAGAMDGVDRLGASYGAVAFTLVASNGSDHGWIVLRSPTAWGGTYIYLLLSANMAGGGTGSCTIIISTAAFTGGSNTTDPTTTGASFGTSTASAAVEPSATDYVNPRRAYFNLTTDGSFWFAMSRAGAAESFLAVINPTLCKAQDSVPVWAVQMGVTNAPNSVQYPLCTLAGTFKSTKNYAGASGYQQVLLAALPFARLDMVDTSAPDFPTWVLVVDSTTSVNVSSTTSWHARGRLPDMGLLSSAANGSTPIVFGNTFKDLNGNVEFVSAGQMILPFNEALV